MQLVMARTNNPNNGHHKRLRISDLFSEGENRTVFGERTALKGHEELSIAYTGMFTPRVGDMEMPIPRCS